MMIDRRELLGRLATIGIGSAVFHRAISALVDGGSELDLETLKKAQWISGVTLSDDEFEEILSRVNRTQGGLAQLRKVELSAAVPMAIHFSPIRVPPTIEEVDRVARSTATELETVPDSETELAFLPVSQLAKLIETRKVTSRQLTELYLSRLKKYAPMLRCVVNFTEELALRQADNADREIAEGHYRGPLHGIPWGAKDLIAVPGYPTTWGIPYFREREIDGIATVAKRLEEAGAVLIAKLSLGALANGDKWFEGMTRSPWNPRRGSSGSSAGSASAVVGGLVGFTLGSETLGSIISPSVRCGASSLRPTFGRVSRHGCMPLSWSLDKIGPICRSLEDCALVFQAIHGADGKDKTAGSYAFQWPSRSEVAGLKIGYRKSSRRKNEEREDLKILKNLGCELVEISLPTDIPLRPFTEIIDIEAASVFDDLLRAGETEGWNAWPQDFRAAQFVSAVDYVKIQRSRTRLMEAFEESIASVDAMVNMNDLLHTNFTGHPSVVMPVGFVERDGTRTPRPIILTGHLHDDERLLSLGAAVQNELTAQLEQPELDRWLERFEAGTLDRPPEKQELEG
jgi:Asp-tRNA(Asn)/Glu-tRNA(Gln) amidotransferase A subunit family amidase